MTPDRIGPYRILQVLGEGGMGIVYEAEQLEPVVRRVALKVIPPGMDSRQVLARFDAEQQALAVMTHAGIAKMLGAGATETGQPYFVMELVSGLPITAYCDMRRLSIAERVSLFIKVCHAVQHAHQKGVIHRDLKPSNILIAEESGQAIPKVIDFGVAKALGRPLTEQTLVTQVGSLVGTVAYMSPEQAEGSGLDVDTRTDVYALGVTLYELLVGRLPVDPIEIGVHQYLARLVSRDSAAPPLSTRLTVPEPELLATARGRRTDPAHLRQQLKGDLDWISAKAIEPERSARYDTVNALAADLERFLRHEPVNARPPSAPYRIRKFVRRHRAAVAATTIAVLALVASSVLATAGMLRASRAEQRAQAEAAAAQQVTGFLVELFRLADPRNAQSRDMKARDLLDRGAQRVRADLAAQPELQTRVMTTIGSVYQRLGLYAPSESLLVDALRVAEQTQGANARAVAASLYELGALNTDRGNFAAADSHFQRALAIREAAADAGDVAQTLFGIGRLRFVQRRLDDAESLFVRSLRSGGPTLPIDVRAARLQGLGSVYWAQGRYASAESAYKEVLGIRRQLYPGDNPSLASTRNNLAAVYYRLERYDEALSLYQESAASMERSLGPAHPNVAAGLHNVGLTLWKLGKLADAEQMVRRSLSITQQAGIVGPDVANSLESLANILRDLGRYREAEPHYQKSIAIFANAFGADNERTAQVEREYAELQRRRQRNAIPK